MSEWQPRPARPGDRVQLAELEETVFDKPLVTEFPQMFADENLPNCRVVELGGRIVSHAGMTVDGVSICGCRVRVACVGAVGTYVEHRGQGYARACFQELIDHARDLGCDFMMVSGSRPLYLAAGCRRVGLDFEVGMCLQQANDVAGGVTLIRRATRADIPALDRLLRSEPIHWERRPATWKDAFDPGAWSVKWGWQVWVIGGQTKPAAWFAADVPRDSERPARITDFAGERNVAYAGFAAYVRGERPAGVVWKVSRADDAGRQAADAAQLSTSPAMSVGTLLVINLPQFMDRVRPYLKKRAGAVIDSLRFVQKTAGATIKLGDETHHLPAPGCIVQFVFGTREERPTPPPTAGRLCEVYLATFPIPLPEYGLDFV